ncbi:retrotransposon protein, putative, ty1-copia subclass [Tanacetum coccineum]
MLSSLSLSLWSLKQVGSVEDLGTNSRRKIKSFYAVPADRIVFCSIDVEEHELGNLGEPANYRAALLDPESKMAWMAMNVENAIHERHYVWVLVELLPMLKPKGFIKTYGVDYEETFSPVADIRAIRILIAINRLYYDYEISKWMSKPLTSIDIFSEKSIWSNLRQWNKRFDDEIKKFGFTQNPDEPCVYLKASGSYVAILILYVDDILLMGNNIPMLQDVKSYLGRSFAMKDLGDAAYILGIKIYRDRSKRLIGLNQVLTLEKSCERILYGKFQAWNDPNARKA